MDSSMVHSWNSLWRRIGLSNYSLFWLVEIVNSIVYSILYYVLFLQLFFTMSVGHRIVVALGPRDPQWRRQRQRSQRYTPLNSGSIGAIQQKTWNLRQAQARSTVFRLPSILNIVEHGSVVIGRGNKPTKTKTKIHAEIGNHIAKLPRGIPGKYYSVLMYIP